MRPDKDVTGKYVVNAGCGGCFGDSVPNDFVLLISGIVHTCILVLETFFFFSIFLSYPVQNKSGACVVTD